MAQSGLTIASSIFFLFLSSLHGTKAAGAVSAPLVDEMKSFHSHPTVYTCGPRPPPLPGVNCELARALEPVKLTLKMYCACQKRLHKRRAWWGGKTKTPTKAYLSAFCNKKVRPLSIQYGEDLLFRVLFCIFAIFLFL